MRKSTKEKGKSRVDKGLSSRTIKQIDSLPEHAQHIYKKLMLAQLNYIKIRKRDVVEKSKAQKR
jgi:cation transport regulator ChaB